MKILFKLTLRLLKAAGYKKLPPHSYEKNPQSENWITQSKWNKNEFPRFHLIKTGKDWDLHYDFWKKGFDKHSTDTKSQIVRNERQRLKKLRLTHFK